MKLILLIILLCGITSTPAHTLNSARAKKACVCNAGATTAKATTETLDMVPSGLLFQF